MTKINDIRERLREIRPHGSTQNIVDAGMVKHIDFNGGHVTVFVSATKMPAHTQKVLRNDIEWAVGALEGVRTVRTEIEDPSQRAANRSPLGSQGPLPGVRDIIAVSSTKGGVGKSTVAANLALAMERLGKRVGLLDADAYGPSLPIMFGVQGPAKMTPEKRIIPTEKFGLQLMSVGLFLDDNAPVIWRGPMVMGLVRQFLKDVDWKDLDVLVVDLPPGTGDAQLTLVQQVPLAGGIVVTTPQDIATLDVQRGIAMFQQVNTPVLGIIENMSVYACPHCGHEEDIFGTGGAARLSEAFQLPLLGSIPMVAEVRSAGDEGQPIVVAQPDHRVSRLFLQIAQDVLDIVERQREDIPAPAIIG